MPVDSKDASDDLNQAEEFLSRLRESLLEQVVGLELSRVSKVPFKAMHYKGALLRRTVELAESCVLLIRTEYDVPAAVVGKALFETAAFEHTLSARMEEVVKKATDVANFDAWITQGLLGNQAPAMPETNLIPDSVAAAVAQVEKMMPGVEKFYRGLSGFAYPNWHGVFQSYSELKPSGDTVTFRNSAESGFARSDALNALVTALAISELAGRKFNKLMPTFTKTCETESGS